ncbi:MAG TPA: FAD-binding protein, partial [Desulfobacteraceae bacterium]|nr:FAD-binding protein [Desulfobacteraceae bacterium]
MKHAKDRLNKVIVIGANISGIAATNKLGELGIPVTLVDGDPDLDKKLSQDQWRLPSGVSFNYAHRPGLLRILRNPLIECKMPAEITSLKHTLQGFRAGVKTLQTFIDPDRCILCGRCVNICPVTTPDGKKPIELDGRRGLPGRPVIDKRRTPLCNSACPLGVNVQAYIALAGAGRFREALEMVRRDNVLPGICGRVCTHPCEASCRRGEMDASIAIRDIKRFLVDYENSGKTDLEVFPVPERSEKIAVIGSGPAGLAAAADLARFGYQVTVFEKEELPGGLLRYGIGPHRLPRKDVDYDLEYIKRLGVEFKTGHNIDLIKDLNRLKSEFDATILTTGIWFDRKIGMPGEELEGIEGCISFLSRLYRGEIKQLKEKAAVIGDGNAAFDLARVLIRLGADVTILSWFPKDDVPADEDEVKGAEDENISFEYSTQ